MLLIFRGFTWLLLQDSPMTAGNFKTCPEIKIYSPVSGETEADGYYRQFINSLLTTSWK